MVFRKDASQEAGVENRRRGVRLNSRVPVALEWEADGGEKFHAEAHTRMVNSHGCLLVLPHDLRLEQRVRLTNLATRQSNPAIVVWKGNERPEGRELGLELLEPEMDFWGLEL